MNSFLRWASRRLIWLMNLPARYWLIAGLIVVNTAAAIPFGISSSDPLIGLIPYEWAASGVFALVAIAYIFAIKNDRVLNIVSTISGGLWFGAAFGFFIDNVGKADGRTLAAITIFPIGIGIVSFALERLSVQRSDHL